MTPAPRRLALLFALAVLVLFALSVMDPEGLRKALRNEAEAGRLARENAALGGLVTHLRREVKALRGDPAALERAAREELGYVQAGEVVYKLDAEGSR